MPWENDGMTTKDVGLISCEFDSDKVWERVRGPKTLLLDSNLWIDMADGKKKGTFGTFYFFRIARWQLYFSH